MRYDRQWKPVSADGELVATTHCVRLMSLTARIDEGDLVRSVAFGRAKNGGIEGFEGNARAPERVARGGRVCASDASDLLMAILG